MKVDRTTTETMVARCGACEWTAVFTEARAFNGWTARAADQACKGHVAWHASPCEYDDTEVVSAADVDDVELDGDGKVEVPES